MPGSARHNARPASDGHSPFSDSLDANHSVDARARRARRLPADCDRAAAHACAVGRRAGARAPDEAGGDRDLDAYVNTAPPSDAIALFDGKSLDEWVLIRDKSPAKWTLGDGVMTVNKAFGGIETKRQFTDYQMHIEWRVPRGTTQTGQSRGNSGIFLASTGSGDTGYELQVLDSYENKTYVNGQAASIYKQSAPLVNAMRPQGEWNVYDIVWTAPRFNADGSLKSPARITVLHNGVLVQNNYTLKGHTPYIGHPEYKPHGPAPIKLQSHGDPSPPISFRNIWIRPL
jgi:hypothetical protein